MHKDRYEDVFRKYKYNQTEIDELSCEWGCFKYTL